MQSCSRIDDFLKISMHGLTAFNEQVAESGSSQSMCIQISGIPQIHFGTYNTFDGKRSWTLNSK